MATAISNIFGFISSSIRSITTITSSSSSESPSSSSLSSFSPNPNPNPNQNRRSSPTSQKRRRQSAQNPNPPNSGPALTEQQQSILSAVADGRSVFITGSAGTGKTYLLSVIIRLLRQLHPPSTVFVTASTGVAACSLGGQTLHSFAGIGLGNGSLDSLLLKVSANESAAARWSLARALVIDEISMIDGQLFDRLDQIARAMRPQDADLPWGGVQLIVSGDFFQLPPVNAPNPSKEFAFEAECWTNSFHLQVELTRIFRQSDSALIDVLQGIRRGQKGNCLCHILEHHCSKPLSSYNDDADDDDRTTRLFPRNEDVKKLNNERLKNLDAVIFHYTAVDRGKEPWKAQLKQGIAPEELEICTGARVMLIKNTDVGMGLVNGATGTVEGFVFDDSLKVGKICRNGGFLPRVKFDSGVELVVKPERWDLMEGEKIRATRKQIPLILAWALSVHKCQGMTLDRLHTDLSRAFGCGMVYVALSRVRSLAGLRLSGFNPYKIRAHPKVVRFYDWLLLSHRP